VILATALFAFGCKLAGPDFVPPQAPEVDEWVDLPSEGMQTTPGEIVDWWKLFNDPVLDELVLMAREQNNTLEIAGLNVLAARAQLGIATGAKWPQTQIATGDVGYIYPGDGEAAPDADFQYNLGLTVSWEIDFWGRFKRGAEAANASLLAAMAGYEDALILVTGLVVDTYNLIRITEERLRIARQNIELQQRSFEITSVLFEYGDASELDMRQAQRQLLSTQSTIPAFDATLQLFKNALNTLLGQPVGVIDELLERGEAGILLVPENIAVGVPADLLRRRPDLRQAEYQAMAQNARVGVAAADLYPRLTLAGSIGAKAGFPDGTEAEDIFDASSITFNAGFGLVWPFLNYGRIRNNIRVQDAVLQQALINYRETALRALQEAEDAMAGFVGAQEQGSILEDTVEAAKRSNHLAQLRYQEGFSDFQRVIDSQQALFTQQDRWITSKSNALSQLVDLFTALGGGWELTDTENWISDETREQMQQRTNWRGYFEEEADDEETEADDDGTE